MPIANVYTDVVDVSPTIGGHRYAPYQENGSWHWAKHLINANPYVYMMALGDGSVNDHALLRKTSMLPTSLDWVKLYSFGNWELVGIDVSLVDPLHIVGHKFRTIDPGLILYSTDGGLTFTDVTGNLVALGWNSMSASNCKFAIGSTAVDWSV